MVDLCFTIVNILYLGLLEFLVGSISRKVGKVINMDNEMKYETSSEEQERLYKTKLCF